MKVGDVAIIFNVTPQTIRNWVKRKEVEEFFSDIARRADKSAHAEFLVSDLYVFNSIQTMLRQKSTWHVIAESLRSGWRETELPDRAALLSPPPDAESHVQIAAHLAIARAEVVSALEIVKQRDTKIAELEAKIERIEVERHREKEQLLREIAQLREEKGAALAEARILLKLHDERPRPD